MTRLAQDGNARLDVAQEQGVLEARHVVAPLLRDCLHHAEALRVAGDEVEERQLVKALGLLVRRLDDLPVSIAIHPLGLYPQSRCLLRIGQ